MNGRMIGALVAKDLALFFRNRFFALITVLALVAYAGIYFLMPATVDETLEMGMFAPALPPAATEALEEAGIILRRTESEAALREAVRAGEYNVGISLPSAAVETLVSGQRAAGHIYFGADFPDELKDAYVSFLQEMAFTLSGQPLYVVGQEQVLGTDMAGRQIPPRDRMLPLFAVIILMMETLGLASLLTEEIEGRTLQALLVTPLRVEGLFAGKAITGVGLAFVQVALLMLVTGGLAQQPLLILLALFLGALLVTGLGFLLASVARDMMSVMAWGLLVIVILALPAFNVLLPGFVSGWVKAIPSYYLVDTVHRVANFGAGWGEVAQNLLLLLASALAAGAIGAFVLRRRFQ